MKSSQPMISMSIWKGSGRNASVKRYREGVSVSRSGLDAFYINILLDDLDEMLNHNGKEEGGQRASLFLPVTNCKGVKQQADNQ